MKKRIKATGAIERAARAAKMGRSRPAWSENFLNEFSEECKSRNLGGVEAYFFTVVILGFYIVMYKYGKAKINKSNNQDDTNV
ncbi:hypothetical protein GW535_16490 (plasmid) [Piscirickettsia salmonis]|uniref:hypothetical protein n=1 Tax=Piscirickettsia salmonis TaxID=1238 RepID=UPI00137BAC0D|nr:hypothetical protein [Piscirickettsia salmonis]QHS34353.1 hypothetical protein GW535_16490 [Piscirickettsia salmonis]